MREYKARSNLVSKDSETCDRGGLVGFVSVLLFEESLRAGRMKKRMKRFKNRRTTSAAAILCMAALLFAVLLAGCSVQKETEASGDQQQETWSEEMENSTALSEEPDDTDTIGNPENPEDTSAALTLPILDEINSKVQIGTSGSSLIAVQAAVKLLDWGEHTGLDPEEIREAASAWLSEQTDSDREEALLKLEMVDDAYQRLLKEDARELLDTAGCADTEIFWGSEPVEPVEAIMQVAGLRKD